MIISSQIYEQLNIKNREYNADYRCREIEISSKHQLYIKYLYKLLKV